jgi:hypothetical protein
VFGAGTTAAAEGQWNTLFGLTFDDQSGFRESLGFYDDGNGLGGTESWYGFNSNPATFNDQLTPPVFDIGVFLVRDVNPVPLPGTLALAALACALVAGTQRSRRSV